MCVFEISMEIQNETNGDLNKRDEWKRCPTRQTTVNFSAYLHEDAKTKRIGLKEALEFGIKFLIADQEGFDYPANNLQEKLHKVVKHRNALIQEVDALRKQIDNGDIEIDNVETKEEMDKVFDAIKPKEVKKDE